MTQFSLVYRHDCQALGCREDGCVLCRYCQRKVCTKDSGFSDKYLVAADLVEAKCGAQIRVQVYDHRNKQFVSPEDSLVVRLCLLDGNRYEKLPAGRLNAADLDECRLFANKKGKELLQPGRGGTLDSLLQTMTPLASGKAELPELRITDSSEALLGGKQPNFYLYAIALRADGSVASDIEPAVSEPFVVATPRTRPYIKYEIPHIQDSVSRVREVGAETQKKLGDLRAAALKAGIQDLHVPKNCVTKVGELKELVETAERNKPMRETLKQLLRLTKGWDTMRDHVMMAVDNDTRLRVWYMDREGSQGVVFQCAPYNVVDIHNPIGVLRRSNDPSGTLVSINWSTIRGPEAEFMEPRRKEAECAWHQSGHPLWFLLPLDVRAPDSIAKENTAPATRARVPRPADCPQMGSLPQQRLVAATPYTVGNVVSEPTASRSSYAPPVSTPQQRIVTSGQLQHPEESGAMTGAIGALHNNDSLTHNANSIMMEDDPFLDLEPSLGDTKLEPPFGDEPFGYRNQLNNGAGHQQRSEAFAASNTAPRQQQLFAQQYQQQPYLFRSHQNGMHHVSAGLEHEHAKDKRQGEMPSLPLEQQFLQNRASAPDYAMHHGRPTPFASQPPAWLPLQQQQLQGTSRPPHLAGGNDTSSPFDDDNVQEQMRQEQQQHEAKKQRQQYLQSQQYGGGGMYMVDEAMPNINSLMAFRQEHLQHQMQQHTGMQQPKFHQQPPQGAHQGRLGPSTETAPTMDSDELLPQLSMMMSSLLKWSDQEMSMRNQHGVVTREKAIQRLSQELQRMEADDGYLQATTGILPNALRHAISNLQQGNPNDGLDDMLQQLSTQYPEFNLDMLPSDSIDLFNTAMGTMMSLGSIENMGSLRDALPSNI